MPDMDDFHAFKSTSSGSSGSGNNGGGGRGFGGGVYICSRLVITIERYSEELGGHPCFVA